jgi:hypothetical protein
VLKQNIVDYATSLPSSTPLDVAICSFSDPDCKSPLARSQTDLQGNVSLPIQPSPAPVGGLAEDSFAQLTGTGIVPELVFLGYPVSEPVAPIGTLVATLTPTELETLLAPAGVTWDTSRGVIVFEVEDCDTVLGASGVKVTIDAMDQQVRRFYLRNHAADVNATGTDGSGLGGFVNVPTGMIVNITATPPGLTKPSSVDHVYVRPGTMSFAFMYPTP